MKKSSLLLIGTLAANAVLVTVLFLRPQSAAARTAPPNRLTDRGAERPASTNSAPEKGSAELAGQGAALPAPEDFAAFFSGDPREILARMRAAGFSQTLQVHVMRALIEEKYADRWRSLPGYDEIAPFWRGTNTLTAILNSPEYRAINNEMSKELREYMGIVSSIPEDPAQVRRQYGNLPMEKIEAIVRIQQDYSQRLSEITTPGILLASDIEKRNQLNTERRESIVAALTPEELHEYDLRTSTSTANLRSLLTGFDASEEEFLAMYRVRKAFDDKWPSAAFSTLTQEQMRDRTTDQQRLNEDLAAVLPPDRAAEFRLLSDSNYRYVSTLTDKLQLPRSVASEAIAVQKDMQQRLNAVRQAASQSGQPPATELENLASEATQRLTGLLGARGFEAYRTNMTGQWLTALTPRTPPAPVPAR